MGEEVAETIIIKMLDNKYREQQGIASGEEVEQYSLSFYPQNWQGFNQGTRIHMLISAITERKNLNDIPIPEIEPTSNEKKGGL